MTKALLIVDVQHDFVEGGSLAVTGGTAVAEKIAAELLGADCAYDLVVTTQDWHIDPGAHFSDTPDYVNSWPVHCVAESSGAEILPAIEAGLVSTATPIVRIFKGQYEDAYSGFMGATAGGQTLADLLREHEVGTVDVVGLAEDYCVVSTAIDSQKAGFQTQLLQQYTAPINVENAAKREAELQQLGGAVN